MITPTINEAQIMTALRAFIQSIVDCEVIKTQVNRVPMPKGDFVAMTSGPASALSTNVSSYTPTTKNVLRRTMIGVQIDCYGATSREMAQAISTLFRDDFAVQSFKSSGFDIQPLYATDAQQMPLVTGEEQYLDRWTFNVMLQYNPLLSVPQQSFQVVPAVRLIEVDTTYPPGPPALDVSYVMDVSPLQ